MSDIERAREALEREQKKTKQQKSMAAQLVQAFRDQAKANNWRSAIDQIVRGQG